MSHQRTDRDTIELMSRDTAQAHPFNADASGIVTTAGNSVSQQIGFDLALGAEVH